MIGVLQGDSAVGDYGLKIMMMMMMIRAYNFHRIINKVTQSIKGNERVNVWRERKNKKSSLRPVPFA